MLKKACAFFLALCLLPALCGCDGGGDAQPGPAPSLSQREQDWLEDIEFLRETCKTKHMDPFYLCSEEEFDWKLDQLSAKVGELSDDDIAFEIVSIVAGLGDPHSYAGARQLYDRRFPIRVSYFDNKLYLTACLKEYGQLEPYLLREIVSVNGVDIAYLMEKANRLGNPFNTWLSRDYFQDGYFLPAFFDWAGCDYKEGYTFQILNDNQEVESVDIPVISSDKYQKGSWLYSQSRDALQYLKGGNWTEYIDGENGGCVYISLAELMDKYEIKQLAKDAGKLLAEHPDCGKLAVDLRNTPGGNAAHVAGFQESAQLLDAEHVYVLTGGTTASAALTFISYFKGELGAVLVGEPTGQFPSMFHMQSSRDKPAVLPHSQISVMLSNAWWDSGKDMPEYGVSPAFEEHYDENGRLYPWESTILPDAYVYQDIEDIRQGKDSVLQWVLAQ